MRLKPVLHFLALGAALLATMAGARGQGFVLFNNRFPPTVVAPIYGTNSGDPTLTLCGNDTTNGGNVNYTGHSLLASPVFTCELWAGSLGTPDAALVRLSTVSFRMAPNAGFIVAPPALAVPGVPGGEMATVQVRAWDNHGGTVSSWPGALADPTVARGACASFTVGPLGTDAASAPRLTNMVSFNIHLPPPPPVRLYINEWLTTNVNGVVDPADGQHDDWFEIYNPGTNTVSLDGYFLTDIMTNQFKFQIPPGYTVPPGGYRLVWADNQPHQNSTNSPDLHVNFFLSTNGVDGVCLSAADGTVIDAITIGPQTPDVSEGRWPDGATNRYFMVPTPRGSNTLIKPAAELQVTATYNGMMGECCCWKFDLVQAFGGPNNVTYVEVVVPTFPPGLTVCSQSGPGLATWNPVTRVLHWDIPGGLNPCNGLATPIYACFFRVGASGVALTFTGYNSSGSTTALLQDTVTINANGECDGSHPCPTNKYVYVAGTNDGYAQPPDQAVFPLCGNLAQYWPWKPFDDPTCNQGLGYAFCSLPSCIIRAELTVVARPNPVCSTGVTDIISIGPDPTGSSFGWGSLIWQLPAAGGTWNANPSTTFTLDLANLPSGSGSVNLLPAINAQTTPFVDVYIQDDTEVDYMQLCVWIGPGLTNCTNIVVDCTDDSGAFVCYAIPGAYSCFPPVTVTCDPPPCSLFAIGVTPVICTAVDRCGSNQCCFSVTVQGHGYDEWKWARKAGSPPSPVFGSDSGNAIAVDKKGNVFVTGSYQGAMNFYNAACVSVFALPQSAGNDIFLAKYDTAGTFLWAVRAFGPGQDAGYGLGVDDNGYAYVTGEFTGSAVFGIYTLTATAGRDIFVAKYDPNGVCVWATAEGGAGDDRGAGIAVTASGNVFVTGDLAVGSTTEAFVLRINGSTGLHGPSDITVSFGSAGQFARGRAIAVDDNFGNPIVYVTGVYGGATTFPLGITCTVPAFTGALGRIFVAKFAGAAPALPCIWAEHSSHTTSPPAAGNHDATGVAVAFDPTLNQMVCYVTAYFHGTGGLNGIANFGNGVSVTNTKLPSSPVDQLNDYLIVKFRANRMPLCAVAGNSAAGGAVTSDDETRGIAVDPAGNPCVTGFIRPNAPNNGVNEGPIVLVASYSSSCPLTLRWTRNAKDVPSGLPDPENIGRGIAADDAGCFHVTGDFTKTLDFPPVTPPLVNLPALTPAIRNVFVAKMCPLCGWDEPQDHNLIVNGGFEYSSPVVASGNFDKTIPPGGVPDWTTTVPSGPNFFEIWKNTYGGIPAYEGVNQLELNAQSSDQTVCQTITNLNTNCLTTFCFWYTGRNDLDGSTYNNDFIVSMTGGFSMSVPLDPPPYSVGGWTNFCTNFVPTSSTLTICFRGMPHAAVESGAHIDDVSLLQNCCASICGKKFNDLNHDGVRNSTEPCLPGWTILVRDGPNGTDNVVGSAVTGANGTYCIMVPLPTGGGSMTFYVEEVQQPGWVQSASPLPVVVTGPATYYGGRDFGNYCPDSPNLLVNGSFEAPVLSGVIAGLPNGSVPGWNGYDGICGGIAADTELWRGATLSVGQQDLNQHLEISSSVANETVCQTVNNLTPGCPTKFSFWYTGRPGVEPNTGVPFDNRFTVTLSGGYASSTTLAPAPYPSPTPAVGGWYNYCSPTFFPSGSTLTIAFSRNPTTGDVGGAHIDNVSLTQNCCDRGDTDGDGMPDAWETGHGLNPNDPSDAAGDLDGDGVTNLQEYLAGTDPTDPNSRLRLEPISFSAGALRLQFQAEPNRSYDLEATPALGGQWGSITNFPAQPVLHTNDVTVPFGTNAARFFRLRGN